MTTLLDIKEDTGQIKATLTTVCDTVHEHENRIRVLESNQPLRITKLNRAIREEEQALQLDEVDHFGQLAKKIVTVVTGVAIAVIGAAMAIYAAIQFT